MKKEKVSLSFTVPVPKDAGNAYELVVIAALRARQLNRYPHLRNRNLAGNLVDQAIVEALGNEVPFLLAAPEEPPPAQESIQE
jgi:DNA-directed RNA polymerase subunit K/omega